MKISDVIVKIIKNELVKNLSTEQFRVDDFFSIVFNVDDFALINNEWEVIERRKTPAGCNTVDFNNGLTSFHFVGRYELICMGYVASLTLTYSTIFALLLEEYYKRDLIGPYEVNICISKCIPKGSFVVSYKKPEQDLLFKALLASQNENYDKLPEEYQEEFKLRLENFV